MDGYMKNKSDRDAGKFDESLSESKLFHIIYISLFKFEQDKNEQPNQLRNTNQP